MSLGTVKIPTLAQLGEAAAELGLSFSEADLAAHLEALRPSDLRGISHGNGRSD
jgi:hypothetical protein